MVAGRARAVGIAGGGTRAAHQVAQEHVGAIRRAAGDGAVFHHLAVNQVGAAASRPRAVGGAVVEREVAALDAGQTEGGGVLGGGSAIAQIGAVETYSSVVVVGSGRAVAGLGAAGDGGQRPGISGQAAVGLLAVEADGVVVGGQRVLIGQPAIPLVNAVHVGHAVPGVIRRARADSPRVRTVPHLSPAGGRAGALGLRHPQKPTTKDAKDTKEAGHGFTLSILHMVKGLLFIESRILCRSAPGIPWARPRRNRRRRSPPSPQTCSG